MQQLSNQSNMDASNSKEKTLKYSKSLENFEMIPNYTQVPRKQIAKNIDEELWADRTEIQCRNQLKL